MEICLRAFGVRDLCVDVPVIRHSGLGILAIWFAALLLSGLWLEFWGWFGFGA